MISVMWYDQHLRPPSVDYNNELWDTRDTVWRNNRGSRRNMLFSVETATNKQAEVGVRSCYSLTMGPPG